MPTRQDIEYLQLHWADDPVKLLFSSSKHPDIDMTWVVQQIEGRAQARTKWTSLAQTDGIWYPQKLNREQSSSEEMGRYKADATWRECLRIGIQKETMTLADLTGGFGIDSLCFSKKAATVDYIEFNEELFRIAEHNFETLGAKNIICHQGDSIEWLKSQKEFDVIYIDPARRDSHGKKVWAFEECTPNLLANLEMMLTHCHLLVVKASPMISIPQALDQLNDVNCIEVVSLKGECKEVLFFVSRKRAPQSIRAIDIASDGTQRVVEYLESEEMEAAEAIRYCTDVGTYLYEPNAAIMKAGCYNLIGTRYNLSKLARNTHLYTSNDLIEGFPGRTFRIIEEAKPKQISRLIPEKKAHVAIRNYPTTAAELQKKLRLQEGGILFVIGTTIGTHPKIYLCEIINAPKINK